MIYNGAGVTSVGRVKPFGLVVAGSSPVTRSILFQFFSRGIAQPGSASSMTGVGGSNPPTPTIPTYVGNHFTVFDRIIKGF